MGIMDGLMDAAKKGIDASKEKMSKQAECNRDKSLNLNIKFGNKELDIQPTSIIRQKEDGTTYFNYDDFSTYTLVEYQWNGPTFENVTTSTTHGTDVSKTNKKGKSGKMATGAIVGTLLFPGVGTVVGAAIGAGGKSKSTTKGQHETNSQQIIKRVEVDNTAVLKLKRLNDNSVCAITITCNSDIDSKIRCFSFDASPSTAEMSMNATDSLNGIKALKELLDMGAITQEEFDTKKKQLLDL